MDTGADSLQGSDKTGNNFAGKQQHRIEMELVANQQCAALSAGDGFYVSAAGTAHVRLAKHQTGSGPAHGDGSGPVSEPVHTWAAGSCCGHFNATTRQTLTQKAPTEAGAHVLNFLGHFHLCFTLAASLRALSFVAYI